MCRASFARSWRKLFDTESCGPAERLGRTGGRCCVRRAHRLWALGQDLLVAVAHWHGDVVRVVRSQDVRVHVGVALGESVLGELLTHGDGQVRADGLQLLDRQQVHDAVHVVFVMVSLEFLPVLPSSR